MKGIRALTHNGPHYRIRLVHGAARGVDSLCADIARARGWEPVPFRADWTRFGKAAGVIRNQQMLDANPAIDIVVAFPALKVGSMLPLREQSRGTWDMHDRCIAAGLTVLVQPLIIHPVVQTIPPVDHLI